MQLRPCADAFGYALFIKRKSKLIMRDIGQVAEWVANAEGKEGHGVGAEGDCRIAFLEALVGRL